MDMLAAIIGDEPARAALRAAYAFNLIVLLPVARALRQPVEGGITLPSSLGISYAGFRGLTGSFWLGLGVLSIAGLVWPLALTPVLALQVICKAAYLTGTELPAIRRGGGLQTSPLLMATFVLIVLVWPAVLGWAWFS